MAEFAKTVRAVIVPVGKEPYTRYLDAKDGGALLRSLREVVGGPIEVLPPVLGFDDEPVVYVNEEGKLHPDETPPNRAIFADQRMVDAGVARRVGEVMDVIFGDFVCVGTHPETLDACDVTDREIGRVMQRFGGMASIVSGDLVTGRMVSLVPVTKDEDPWWRSYEEPKKPVSLFTEDELRTHGLALACRYLDRRGMAVTSEGVRAEDGGTIDIVARDGKDTVVLVDVSCRFDPEEDEGTLPPLMVTDERAKVLRKRVLELMAKDPQANEARYDVISIDIEDDLTARLRYLIGVAAFEAV